MFLRSLRALPLATLLLALPACGSGGAGAGSTATTSTASAVAPAAHASGGATDVVGGGSGVVARVNGKDITYAELDQAAASQLVRLRSQAYDARKQTLDGMIDDALIEAEATKRGISSEDLVKAEVTDKVKEPTDEEAKEYFDKNPPRGNVDFDKIKPRVVAFMKRQAEQDARVAFISSLREAAGVEVMLEPLRFDVAFTDADPIHGSKDAPVVIVEFSDFQCPYCSRAKGTVDEVMEAYGDKVAVVFRDFPLPMHAEAPKAHEAANCANEQGKFWPYHDLLFANQRALKEENLKEYAGQVGLDAGAFETCLSSGKYADAVTADKDAGAAVGVSGTPAFFINGQFLNGARPIEQFKELIDGELKAQGLL